MTHVNTVENIARTRARPTREHKVHYTLPATLAFICGRFSLPSRASLSAKLVAPAMWEM